MTLVAVVNILVYADRVQQTHTADAEQHLLFESVLPVSAVEVVGDGAILFPVQIVVGVEQVELRAADIAPPNTSRNDTSR